MHESEAAALDYRQYALRPLVLDAGRAHREQLIRYDEDGTAWLRHPEHERLGLPAVIAIGTDHQFCAIRTTFEDLQRPLLGVAKSPLVDGTYSLSDLYEQEVRSYAALAADAYAAGVFEPDYGSYVFDRVAGNLYLVAPERWHRFGLVASNSKLLTDPEGKLSWIEIRRLLEGAVLGFAGASVGGNLLEGWLREARPKCVKLADPDRVELTNFNRAERVSLRHLVQSRSQRTDLRDSRQTKRVSKAEYLAYEQQLVDPYLDIYVYKEGLTRDNLNRFFLGDGQTEPPIDILVEEMDNLELKIEVRKLARQHRVDVLMVTDFGNVAHAAWNPFKEQPNAPLSQTGQDDAMLAALAALRAGDRRGVFEFASHLCGSDEFRTGTFGAFVRSEGEHVISGVPQSGATAMASGAIGGKELALRVLGHRYPSGNRVLYDLAAREGRQG
ncbi:MAG TPA: hypothetical protein VJU61_08655 [Polyangiaceae bacterium]|nr:hypothetical protein [Polyangiaceae bacterium]